MARRPLPFPVARSAEEIAEDHDEAHESAEEAAHAARGRVHETEGEEHGELAQHHRAASAAYERSADEAKMRDGWMGRDREPGSEQEIGRHESAARFHGAEAERHAGRAMHERVIDHGSHTPDAPHEHGDRPQRAGRR